ncbi:NupC/NupG family nucleoside CNT transporter [Mucilaginibacter hurinus]|uniref:NupC/NupG family nucleoside CNT transporter n=1 Tax=Mucilaginibacter hurinus TaxID=2201324 RepID=A0A367GRD5_9SPHI|nr:nucleoside transporter C-terminal domain-containing protein [Mucilaginibacter hurinus]RCH56024.1 NupC/NupG family nucleoside CNT transporter [Mucilaginibacter hurinus]
MERYTGLIGIVLILGVAFLMSNNRKAINYRVVLSGLAIQLALAVFILKTDIGKNIFASVAAGVKKLLSFSDHGAEFVFGVVANENAQLDTVFGQQYNFIFFFRVIPTIVFVAVLISILYYLGIMQRVVKGFAWVVYKLMGVSGAEAVSNTGSTFLGQVEAQILIKPYLKNMTMSELLASMTGSMACIAGGIMATYIALGVPAEYLLAASVMAAPGALVISKIVWPETQVSETKGKVVLEIKSKDANLVDAIARGASDGFKIGLNVIAMLIGFIAIVALLDHVLGEMGYFLATKLNFSLSFINIDLKTLSLKQILGALFSIFAWAMGVPSKDVQAAGSLMGTKVVLNEFVAYLDMVKIQSTLHPKTLIITSFALCGFANFGSVAIQVGGIGEMAPERRSDLAKLGIKALICGTLASYMSATIAGILM